MTARVVVAGRNPAFALTWVIAIGYCGSRRASERVLNPGDSAFMCKQCDLMRFSRRSLLTAGLVTAAAAALPPLPSWAQSAAAAAERHQPR
jgi:hypothetical protein